MCFMSCSRLSFPHTCIHPPGRGGFAADSTLGRAVGMASDAGCRSDVVAPAASPGLPDTWPGRTVTRVMVLLSRALHTVGTQ